MIPQYLIDDMISTENELKETHEARIQAEDLDNGRQKVKRIITMANERELLKKLDKIYSLILQNYGKRIKRV